MHTEILPTAEGNLGRTPFAHLLVYAADQNLTGALFLHEPSGTMHSIRLEGGRPVKVQVGDGYARFGQVLIEEGVIDSKTYEGLLGAPGLIGDKLVAGGYIERGKLDMLADRQFLMRMTHMFELPGETKYTYFADLNELVEDGAPLSKVHPLTVIWTGLRKHGASSPMLPQVLERIAGSPLKLHPAAAIDRLEATPEERSLLDFLQTHPKTLPEFIETNQAHEAMIHWMVYALVITRMLDFGNGALPIFPEPRSIPPPVSASPVTLARIRLQQNATRRFVAAAPDDVGDGERIRPQPRTRKRSRASSESPAVRNSELPPPPSAVVETDPSPPVVPKPETTPTTFATTTPIDPSVEMDALPPMPVAPEGRPNAARPAHALYCLATKRLAEGDKKGALAACQLAREIDPDQIAYALLAIWIRSIMNGSDLEGCVSDLDKLLEDHPDHVPALFYRGYLRRRVGNETGASADLRHVLEIDPSHEDAARELQRLQLRAPAKRPSGLFRP